MPTVPVDRASQARLADLVSQTRIAATTDADLRRRLVTARRTLDAILYGMRPDENLDAPPTQVSALRAASALVATVNVAGTKQIAVRVNDEGGVEIQPVALGEIRMLTALAVVASLLTNPRGLRTVQNDYTNGRTQVRFEGSYPGTSVIRCVASFDLASSAEGGSPDIRTWSPSTDAATNAWLVLADACNDSEV